MADDDSLGVRKLWALGHPLRARILDLLAEEPATATDLARQLGVTSGTTSYHLRELAKADLIVDLQDRGTGRDRVWFSPFNARNVALDDYEAAGSVASRALLRARAQNASRSSDFLEMLSQGTVPERWRSGPVDLTAMLRLSPDELQEFTDEIQEVIHRWAVDRDPSEPSPPGAGVVEVTFRAAPTDRTLAEDAGTDQPA